MVSINSEFLDVAGITISDYLKSTSYDIKRIAIELNGKIVPKAMYNETVLMNDDSLEIVSFVGGG